MSRGQKRAAPSSDAPRPPPPPPPPPVTVALVDQRAQAETDEYDEDHDEDQYTDLGCKGEYEGVVHVRATIAVGGEQVGDVALVLIDRDICDNHQDFWEACDSESGEMEEIASSFNRVGLFEGEDNGLFAYVSSFRIRDPATADPQSDVATEALQQLKGLVGFDFCVYIPEPDTHMSAAENSALDERRWRASDERRFGLGVQRTAEAEQEKRTQDEQHVERIQRGVRRDMTPFLRVGFQQADELLQPGKTPFLYCGAFSWLINPLTHEAGSAPGLVTPPLPFPFQDW